MDREQMRSVIEDAATRLDEGSNVLDRNAATNLRALLDEVGEPARLDPDMPTQELRLHMGELTDDEVRVVRAAIRWANSALILSREEDGNA